MNKRDKFHWVLIAPACFPSILGLFFEKFKKIKVSDNILTSNRRGRIRRCQKQTSLFWLPVIIGVTKSLLVSSDLLKFERQSLNIYMYFALILIWHFWFFKTFFFIFILRSNNIMQLVIEMANTKIRKNFFLIVLKKLFLRVSYML